MSKTPKGTKRWFPKHSGKGIYADTAASSLLPCSVIKAMTQFLNQVSGNPHSGSQAAKLLEDARERVAQFIGGTAQPNEVIFTHNATQALRLAAEIVDIVTDPATRSIAVTQADHDANFNPWEVLSEPLMYARTGYFYQIPLTTDGLLDVERWPLPRPDVLALNLTSNVTGITQDVQDIRTVNPRILVLDATQAMAHFPIGLITPSTDMIAFSGHKMYGPTGIGVLWCKRKLLEAAWEKLRPGVQGVKLMQPSFFEYGTPNVLGAVGLAAACDFIQSVGWETIQNQEHMLADRLYEELCHLNNSGVEVLGAWHNRLPIMSLKFKHHNPAGVWTALAARAIRTRCGLLCAVNPHEALNCPLGSLRISLAFHHTLDDVSRIVVALKEVLKNVNP